MIIARFLLIGLGILLLGISVLINMDTLALSDTGLIVGGIVVLLALAIAIGVPLKMKARSKKESLRFRNIPELRVREQNQPGDRS